MELELERRIFYTEDFQDREEMKKTIDEFVLKLKREYPEASVTKEFYKGDSILVRATKFFYKNTEKDKEDDSKDLEFKRQRNSREKEKSWYQEIEYGVKREKNRGGRTR